MHLAEDERLRQVIVQVGKAGILRDAILEDGNRLVEFEVIEIGVPLVDQGLLPAKRRGHQRQEQGKLKHLPPLSRNPGTDGTFSEFKHQVTDGTFSGFTV